MITAYLGLGSNVGQRLRNLHSGIKLLGNLGLVVQKSSVYETEPWGAAAGQRPFLNMAVELETALSLPDLFNELKRVERKLGRMPDTSNLPRTFDADILLYGELVFEDKKSNLFVPHKDLPFRAFVLVPMVEIAPDVKHPRLKKSMASLLSNLAVKGVNLAGTAHSTLSRSDESKSTTIPKPSRAS